MSMVSLVLVPLIMYVISAAERTLINRKKEKDHHLIKLRIIPSFNQKLLTGFCFITRGIKLPNFYFKMDFFNFEDSN